MAPKAVTTPLAPQAHQFAPGLWTRSRLLWMNVVREQLRLDPSVIAHIWKALIPGNWVHIVPNPTSVIMLPLKCCRLACVKLDVSQVHQGPYAEGFNRPLMRGPWESIKLRVRPIWDCWIRRLVWTASSLVLLMGTKDAMYFALKVFGHAAIAALLARTSVTKYAE